MPFGVVLGVVRGGVCFLPLYFSVILNGGCACFLSFSKVFVGRLPVVALGFAEAGYAFHFAFRWS